VSRYDQVDKRKFFVTVRSSGQKEVFRSQFCHGLVNKDIRDPAYDLGISVLSRSSGQRRKHDSVLSRSSGQRRKHDSVLSRSSRQRKRFYDSVLSRSSGQRRKHDSVLSRSSRQRQRFCDSVLSRSSGQRKQDPFTSRSW